MKLSKRLQTIASFVKKDTIIADIGTDHAHVPIYLIQNGIIQKAYALDINEGPLKKAKENIKNFGYENKIITILSNGLDKLSPYEVDTIIIAGMGGELIIDILERGEKFHRQTFILSPHTKICLVREYLLNNGFSILKEDMCIDEGKYYTVIEAKFTQNDISCTDRELLFGKYLIENKNLILLKFLEKEKHKYEQIISNKGLNNIRKKELLNKLAIIKETINEMQ